MIVTRLVAPELCSACYLLTRSGYGLRFLCVLVIGAFQLGTSNTTYAQDARFSKEDVELLPAYCRDTQSFAPQYGTPGGSERRMAQMGSTFHHLHHYCLAQVAMRRATDRKVSSYYRNHLYQSALNDIDYVLERATADFVLLPEILTRKGEVLIKLKKAVLAEEPFRKAMEIKPDYWPAYRDLAKLYIDSGRRDEARTTLESGIAAVSEKRVLQRMLDDLTRSK